MPESQLPCSICGATADLKCGEHPGYQEPSTYATHHCAGCDTSFSGPGTIDPRIYENIHRQIDRIPGYSRYPWRASVIKGVRDPLGLPADREPVYWAIQPVLSEAKGRDDLRMFDVGSGLSYLTYALVRAGWNARGIDAFEERA